MIVFWFGASYRFDYRLFSSEYVHRFGDERGLEIASKTRRFATGLSGRGQGEALLSVSPGGRFRKIRLGLGDRPETVQGVLLRRRVPISTRPTIFAHARRA